MKTYILIIAGLFCTLSIISCSKYLDEKPDNQFATLDKLQDIQAFLDNDRILNTGVPNLLEVGADNYYLKSSDWNSQPAEVRSVYLWQKADASIYISGGPSWPYQAVLYSNIALEEAGKHVKTENKELRNNIEGSALFFRSMQFFMIAQVYAKPYHKNSSENDLGIPLRLSSDFEEKTTRASIKATYDQILKDLTRAASLLPEMPREGIKTRPSKGAAYGMLSRVYLSIQEYDSAGFYANKSLSNYNELLDLNQISNDFSGASSPAPFKRFNREIIFYARATQPTILARTRAKIDLDLYASYNDNDLRKTAYFIKNTGTNAGTIGFKGDYDGSGTSSGYVFFGVTTPEMYLTRAECYVRQGKLAEAMKDLNTLMRKRWNNQVNYPEFTATNQTDGLRIILDERRKELLFRGTRWMDMRRLAQENLLSIYPKRVIDGVTYEWPREYTYQIPFNVIQLTGIPQNP